MKSPASDASGSSQPKPVLPRRSSQEDSRVSWFESGPLPSAMRGETVRRLGISALFTAGLSLAFTVLFVLTGQKELNDRLARYYRPGTERLLPALTLMLIGVSIWLWRWTRRPDADHRRILAFGAVYELLIVLALSVQHHLHGWEGVWFYSGWSGTAFVMVAFAMVVPSTPGRTLVIVSAGAIIDALAFFGTVWAGAPSPRGGVVAMLLIPDIFAIAVAYLQSLVVHRLGKQIARAQLMGSYRLVAKLGNGGMGEVWRAEHNTLPRPAAIKLIRPGVLGGDPSTAAAMANRFEREAQATALLCSAHTIRVFDHGQAADGSFFYVMELLDGIDLEQFVTRFGTVAPARAIYILRQICHSLAEAHARGFVHRDIKPSNIFLCRYGLDVDHVKVLDFGIVKPTRPGLAVSAAQTQQGTVSGTPTYLAPEQARTPERVDGRSDLYALGCVAFWLLTGRRVFSDPTALGQIVAHMSQQPDRVSQHAMVPPELDAIVHCCLAKRQEDRFPNAATLDAALAAVPTGGAWTQAKARAFWAEHLPDAPSTPEPVVPGSGDLEQTLAANG